MPHDEPPTAPPRDAASLVHRLEVPVREDRVDQVAAALWAWGASGVWERPGELVAWFPAHRPDLDGPAAPSELAPHRCRWSVEPDRDWQAEWKRTIEPVVAGRVRVVPTWLAREHVAGPDELTVVLDPGRAFGSGHHATTTLCLEELDELALADGLAGRTVADVGCGTGVLAIAAAAWGAAVTALDIDADAVEVTRENAARNAVTLDAVVGSAADVRPPAEVVVANLVTDTVVALADELVGACSDVLIVSGIAAERRDRALAALTAAGARTQEVRHRDGWIVARLSTTPAGSTMGAGG